MAILSLILFFFTETDHSKNALSSDSRAHFISKLQEVAQAIMVQVCNYVSSSVSDSLIFTMYYDTVQRV